MTINLGELLVLIDRIRELEELLEHHAYESETQRANDKWELDYLKSTQLKVRESDVN